MTGTGGSVKEHLERALAGRPASRDRFLTALRGGRPDFVPMFEFLDSQDLYEALLGHRPERYNARDAVEASVLLGLDAVFIPYGGFKGYSPPKIPQGPDGAYIDEWGTIYKSTGLTWPSAAPVAYPITTKADLSAYRMPDPTDPVRLDEVRLALELSAGRTAVLGGINGPLTVAFVLAGWETIMVALHEDPEFVDDLFRIGAEYYGEACSRMIDAGVDAICVAEDLGFSTGLFMSPRHYRRYLFPLLRDLIWRVRQRGVPVLLHCDGNIHAVLEDLVAMGIDGYHPAERKAGMDIAALKRHYGERLCLTGNVDSSDLLCKGTPAEVEAQVLELLGSIAPGGAYVLASDSDVRNEMPVANILALFATGRKYGKYPISVGGPPANQRTETA